MICTVRNIQATRQRADIIQNQIGVVGLIGNTPLVPIRRFATELGFPETVELWLKAEWMNPGGSIKDRTALAIIQTAGASGELGSSQVLLDATSGNTGIAYAFLGAALGIPVQLVVPASASRERLQTLVAYGAKLTLSDPYDGSDGAIRLVRERWRNNPDRYFYADQYSNPANLQAHATTTGPEVWAQSNSRLTHFVAALSTTGTLMGSGRFLKTQREDITLGGVQPAEAFHGIEGLKHLPTAITPAIYDPSVPDRQIGVETDEAFDFARRLARTVGLFVGSSTGANLAAAARIGHALAKSGQTGMIVVIACDGGTRYLTPGLWDFPGAETPRDREPPQSALVHTTPTGGE
jgi:cysteine synthase B